MQLPDAIAGAGTPDPFQSLAARNLMRGDVFKLPSGQDVADAFDVDQSDRPALVIGENVLTFDDILKDQQADAKALQEATPLWLYTLAEAQDRSFRAAGQENRKTVRNPDVGTQLGPVGGRILLEVFLGILGSDPDSYLNAAQGRDPMVKRDGECITLWDILRSIGTV